MKESVKLTLTLSFLNLIFLVLHPITLWQNSKAYFVTTCQLAPDRAALLIRVRHVFVKEYGHLQYPS